MAYHFEVLPPSALPVGASSSLTRDRAVCCHPSMTRILSWCSAMVMVLVAVLVAALAGVVAPAPGAQAAGDPPGTPEPHLIKACGTGVLTFSDACIAGALSAFNAARAKEGLG